jgi:hypothetical protein
MVSYKNKTYMIFDADREFNEIESICYPPQLITEPIGFPYPEQINSFRLDESPSCPPGTSQNTIHDTRKTSSPQIPLEHMEFIGFTFTGPVISSWAGKIFARGPLR